MSFHLTECLRVCFYVKFLVRDFENVSSKYSLHGSLHPVGRCSRAGVHGQYFWRCLSCGLFLLRISVGVTLSAGNAAPTLHAVH